jgi:hypothetical protein
MFHTSAFAAVTVAALTLPSTNERGYAPASHRETVLAPTQKAASRPTGQIAGRVISADTAQALRRARVVLTSSAVPDGRTILTDDNGAFAFAGLPSGWYMIIASKTGFVSVTYGQSRPMQAGTPLRLGEGQELSNMEFRLPRGSVISGHVYDANGDPMRRATVQVIHYEHVEGERRLVTAAMAQTDDRGEYRVWDLLPGNYFVRAQTRSEPPRVPSGDVDRRASSRTGPWLFSESEGVGQKTYALTYYPGATSVNSAGSVRVGLSQEVASVDFQVSLIAVSSVTGKVFDSSGLPTSGGNVVLISESNIEQGYTGINYGASIQADGSFNIAEVPPDRYVLRARSDERSGSHFASQALAVGTGEAIETIVSVTAGASINGTVVFKTGRPAVPRFQPTIGAVSTEEQIGRPTEARADGDGNFDLRGIPPGPSLIRVMGATPRWWLESIVLDGRDVTDVPVELKSGQKLTNAVITLTDQTTEIDGMIANQHGEPQSAYTVLAFSTTPSLWQSPSRHIMTARPDQSGVFALRGLPAGEYFVTVIDPIEDGEWLDPQYLDDHRNSAARISLHSGDVASHNFVLAK